MNPLTDGIDHLNVYSKGKTFCKQLTNMYSHTFTYKGIEFNSVEQAWHYYKFKGIGNTKAAQLMLNCNNAFECKKLAKDHNNEDCYIYVQQEEFQSIIKACIEARLENDSNLRVKIRNSWLPFKHYYAYGDDQRGYTVKDETEKYSWLMEILEDIRTKLWFDYLDDLLARYGNRCFNKATASDTDIYVGRGSKAFNVTYGNPFPISAVFKAVKKTNRELFDKAVAKSVIEYRSYLLDEIRKDPQTWYKALNALRLKNVQCFCNDGSTSRELGGGFCHSLILKQFSENLDSLYQALGL